MMEKLGSPQTHLALKAMIREVDEDNDNKISFREVRQVCLLGGLSKRIVLIGWSKESPTPWVV